MVFNCYKPEITIKYILNTIQDNISSLLADRIGEAKLKELIVTASRQRSQTLEDQIYIIYELIKTLREREVSGKFLLILNNLDGPSFTNKLYQNILGHLLNSNDILILTTIDNLYINYFWTQTIKDNFSFYFLKFHTFEHYDLEVNDKNSLDGDKSTKTGKGLMEILKCFTKDVREGIKLIAKTQLEGDNSKLTENSLQNLFIDNRIAYNHSAFAEFLVEPLDHELIIKRKVGNNKEIYKLNLENEILQKLVDGDFDEK